MSEKQVFLFTQTRRICPRSWTVTNQDDPTVLYHVAMNTFRRPSSKITRTNADGLIVATAEFKMWTRSFELSITLESSAPIKIQVTHVGGFFSHEFRFNIEGQEFTFDKMHLKGAKMLTVGSMKLVDSLGQEWAIFTSSQPWNLKRIGKLEIKQPNLDSKMVEALVFTTIAVVDREKRRRYGAGPGYEGI